MGEFKPIKFSDFQKCPRGILLARHWMPVHKVDECKGKAPYCKECGKKTGDFKNRDQCAKCAKREAIRVKERADAEKETSKPSQDARKKATPTKASGGKRK